jgi:hypothetical protein
VGTLKPGVPDSLHYLDSLYYMHYTYRHNLVPTPPFPFPPITPTDGHRVSSPSILAPHMVLYRPGLPTGCVVGRSFLPLEVAFVITFRLKREGESRADSAVLYLCRCGLCLYPCVRLQLVFVGGTNHQPQMPDALPHAPQEEGPKAEGAVQARRLGPLLS